ncbi:helix-turn-helix transcriptional regulator [Bacillus cereus]|uniref:helix-turn-helix domain-containing protein n=1 Tax=Bacillus cereus TaxID=1396 RepID=UPI003012BB04
MAESIGGRIKEVRNDLGMTQRALADEIGVNFTMVSLYESNKREPSKGTVAKISKLTNVSADYLLCLSDHKTLDQDKSRAVTKEVDEIMERINNLDPEKRAAIINLIKNI